MTADKRPNRGDLITLFLCGDVMTGRGIDQILPHPGKPRIYEPYMTSARGYIRLAEEANGPIPRPASFAYVWGDALDELERAAPDARLINLETSITRNDTFWPGKGIQYRMNPDNVACLAAAGIDCCALANNHVLDWDYAGLVETLEALERVNIKTAGAGRTLAEAQAPAVLEVAGVGRVVVFAFGMESSGVLSAWAAAEERAGVALLRDLSGETVRHIGALVEAVKQPGDVVVVSIHWGENWGYAIPLEQQAFAHQLIDQAEVDIIHGHSSHHVKGLEVYRRRPILYGCGDFLTDYEGIGGYEGFRDDLGLMYFPSLDPAAGELVRLRMVPTRLRRFRVNRASRAEAEWLAEVLNREGEALGTGVVLEGDGTLTLKWD